MQSSIPEETKETALTIFSDPLGWLAADIERQRRICRDVTLFAGKADPDDTSVARCIDWLKTDIPTRYSDETHELLPILALRARKDDDVKSVTTRLLANHRTTLATIREILVVLEAAQREAVSQDAPVKKQLVALAAQERTHLALLNAVILPIARLRLAPEDCKVLGEAMAARRGIIP